MRKCERVVEGAKGWEDRGAQRWRRVGEAVKTWRRGGGGGEGRWRHGGVMGEGLKDVMR